MCFLCKKKQENFNEPAVIRNSTQMVKTIEKIAEGMLPKRCEVICCCDDTNHAFRLRLKDHLCDLEVDGSFHIYMDSCDEGYYYDIISNALDLLPKMKEELNKKRDKKFIQMMKEKDGKSKPEPKTIEDVLNYIDSFKTNYYSKCIETPYGSNQLEALMRLQDYINNGK